MNLKIIDKTLQSPIILMFLFFSYPEAGMDKNYCRIPDGEDTAWCYTMDKDEMYEHCDIRTCWGSGTN